MGNSRYKFRVWDIRLGLGMSIPFSIGSQKVEFNKHGRVWDITPDFVNHEFMQYTGLLDKNGKEIYEGDILENHLDKSVVMWGCFSNLAGFQVESPYINIFDSGSVEIIGNIFENPELTSKE